MKSNKERLVLIVFVLISFFLSSVSIGISLGRNDKVVTIGKDNLEMTMLYQDSGQVVIGTHSAHVQFLSDSIILRGDGTYFESEIYSDGELGISESFVCGEAVLSFRNGILIGVE